MDSIFQQISDWLREMLIAGIMDNLSGLFDSVNDQVGDIASQVELLRRISRRGCSHLFEAFPSR